MVKRKKRDVVKIVETFRGGFIATVTERDFFSTRREAKRFLKKK